MTNSELNAALKALTECYVALPAVATSRETVGLAIASVARTIAKVGEHYIALNIVEQGGAKLVTKLPTEEELAQIKAAVDLANKSKHSADYGTAYHKEIQGR
jgi:hypothetical protein